MRSSFTRPRTTGTSAVVATLALLSCTAAPAVAQESAPSLDSYRRAREVLVRGIDAMGGLDSIRAIQDVTVEQLGIRHLRNQSMRADPPYTTAPWSATLVFDARNGRLRSDQEGMGSVGFPFRNRVVSDGRQRFTADLLSRTVTPGGDAAISAHQALLDRLPHLLLTDQLDRAASLRWLGEATVGGTRYRMISGASGPATRTYFFDAGTGLLARYETVGSDAIAGDVVTEVAFTDYRKVGPIMVPSRRTQRVAGELVQDDRYTDVRLNTRPADSLFVRPAAFAERAPGGQWPQGMMQVAPGLHLLQGVAQGYNMLVAEFGDHLVVVEAPNNSAVTERAIAAIKRAIPGKPIRYVVPTHHHGDHAAARCARPNPAPAGHRDDHRKAPGVQRRDAQNRADRHRPRAAH